mmetsp:Transcript_9613/g.14004  ORF Transcript_9613/g.14004 Transcript_9613/m.14004 type:complete len:317 (-) Transcript_9613:22-972(-)|eukprot:CAMPEP_0175097680 /NCGR_PEP_ID=MMETSP0086_2-20121207/5416_1 /TAXON_ID=136419 /ORGANISM="Unknown Unknown, Strain D1" /LENGTH=316 /DNA_ID=CAMNT_0016371207 /DNA_START=27 /DNA_END=977 /DNA_ORIENTATION=+
MSKPNSERPPDSDFQQQNLKAWQPLLTPGWVIVTFFFISSVFIPIGGIVLDASNKVHVQEERYDHLPGKFVQVNLTIEEDMKQPIYFYYKLSNFYQNHRRYVKSRSDKQLRGDDTADLQSCDPLEKNKEGKQLYPCGLVAQSYFNDTFTKKDNTTEQLPFLNGDPSKTIKWNDTNIAWASDRESKFKNLTGEARKKYAPLGVGGFALPDVTQEDFIVWMRTAGLPTFKKLRYRIEQDLKKGDVLTIWIQNTFPVKEFKGEKAVIISTTSWLGGKNDFLGYAYVIVGAMCFLLGLVFLFKHCFCERQLGDMGYFNYK